MVPAEPGASTKPTVEYDKFYDDYERGTWFVGRMANGYLHDRVIVSGLTGPQADDVVKALEGVRDDAGRMAEALLETWLEYHALGAVRDHWADPITGKIGDGPVHRDSCDDLLCEEAREALIAHAGLT